MPTPYDPNSPLPPKLQRVRKLLVSVFATTSALVTWLSTDSHTAVEIFGAVLAWAGTNFGVYQADNADE